MGFLGGEIGYRLLKSISRTGETGYMDGSAYAHVSKLETLLGPDIWDRIRGRSVIDFGCGAGGEAIEIAQHGAARVEGIDIQEKWLAVAREEAAKAGISDRCRFATAASEPADVVVAIDSFEHVDDLGGVLAYIAGMLKPDGYLLAAFGPTWYHPLGGHLFSVFPWAHLIFTERALLRWRADFKDDGATRFHEVAGGLNQMTIGRFERLVAASPLKFAEFEARPIQKLRPLANRLTREFTTAIVRCKLVHRR
ncbi:MAG: class I SAM-dependent methyltransferase [Pirellulales bacterium]